MNAGLALGAYDKGPGGTSTRIAPLELLQSFVYALAFTSSFEGVDSQLEVAGVTDNRGNSFVVAKMLRTKWSLVAILAELGW